MASASPTVFFENATGRLLADPAGFLRVEWSPQPRTVAELQLFCEHIILVLKQMNWCRILGNQKEMRSFSPAEQQWITQHWIPRAVQEGGYRYGALLVSADVLVRLATAYVTTSVQGLPLTYRSFEHETEALHWLLQQPAHA